MTNPNTFPPLAAAPGIDALLITISKMVRKEGEYKSSAHLYQQHPPSPWLGAIPENELIKGGSNNSGGDYVDLWSREQMAQWCLQIVEHCGFANETAEVAMGLLDRSLSVGNEFSASVLSDKSAFQLPSMTALYCVIKIREPKAISPDTMAGLSHGAYKARQIEEMELKLLQNVRWLVHPPTTAAFTHGLVELLAHFHRRRSSLLLGSDMDAEGMRETLLDLCSMQTNLAIVDYGTFGCFDSSAIALAALRNALKSLKLDQDRYDPILVRALVTDLAIIPDFSRCVSLVEQRLLEAIIRKEGNERSGQDDTADADADAEGMEYEKDPCSLVEYATTSNFDAPHVTSLAMDDKECIDKSMHEGQQVRCSPRCVHSHQQQMEARGSVAVVG